MLILFFSGDCSTYYSHFIPEIEENCSLLTFTGSERLECIQKDRCETFYTDGGQIRSFLRTNPYCGTTKRILTVKSDRYISDYPSEHNFFQVHKSSGDDIEDFYDRIKNNEVTCKNGRERGTQTPSDKYPGWDFLESFLSQNLTVKTFHLSMLSETEEREISSGVITNYHDTKYQIINYFKNETTLSKNIQNYALSLCARRTYYHDRSQRIIWDIAELDPWQEKIQKNFQANRKSHEAPLFNYWESDSDSNSD